MHKAIHELFPKDSNACELFYSGCRGCATADGMEIVWIEEFEENMPSNKTVGIKKTLRQVFILANYLTKRCTEGSFLM